MDLDLFCNAKVPEENPNILAHDLVSHFALQKIFKDYKKKKPNRALPVPLKAIISIEIDLQPPVFQLSNSEKQQLFS